jgi:hypothetical protein
LVGDHCFNVSHHVLFFLVSESGNVATLSNLAFDLDVLVHTL